MNSIVDSHCHLDFNAFKNDLNEVIKRAMRNGVKYFLTISIDLEKFNDVLKVAKDFPNNVWCTTGIHPNNVQKNLTEKDFEKIISVLKKNITHNKREVIGVGETGLDYFRTSENKKNQQKSFDLHLQVSGTTNCPVIIHSRAADQDTKLFLKNKVKLYNTKGLMHCFSSSKELAKTALDNDFFISIAGMVTFKNSHDLKKIVQYIPNDKILVETDSPYLSPEPQRGKRNEPAYIINTIKVISKIKKISEEEMVDLTTKNFFNLFSNISK